KNRYPKLIVKEDQERLKREYNLIEVFRIALQISKLKGFYFQNEANEFRRVKGLDLLLTLLSRV
ncbi:MAG: hypothetical protein MJE63_24295, partial [Proteobacteria bacterium]|nr:hypothetical protein [Pseudomonadota bacterium]